MAPNAALERRQRVCNGHRKPRVLITSTVGWRPCVQTHAATEAAAAAAERLHQWGPLVERCTAQTWRRPLPGHDGPPSSRPIVALGKFDALHRGHMALAATAAALGGSPLLLSFSGMAEVLGWQQRLPLVAPCDRSRVLDLWAQELGLGGAQQQQASWDDATGEQEQRWQQQQQQEQQQQQRWQQEQVVVPVRVVRQRYIPFSCIRHLSPEAFVQLLAEDLKAAGVVAGVNYRFGYKAAGDVATLQRLASEHGLGCSAVSLVGLDLQQAQDGQESDEPPVSSSLIRELLSSGKVDGVQRLMGRPYRLVAAVCFGQQQQQADIDIDDLANAAHGDSNSSSGSSSGSNGSSSGSGTCGDQPRNRTGVSTSSMDGSESEVVPLQLREGGRLALVALEGLLNTAPGAGRYRCAMAVYLGASPTDELLHLEAACRCTSSSGSSSGSGGMGTSSSSKGGRGGSYGNITAAGGGGFRDAVNDGSVRSAGSGSDSTAASQAGANSSGAVAPSWEVAATAAAAGQRCLLMSDVEAVLSSEGLLLPGEPLMRAMAAGLGGQGHGEQAGALLRQALVVLDFMERADPAQRRNM